LGVTVTNQNCVHKRRLNSGNAHYKSTWNVLSWYLLSKSIKIKIYIPIIFTCCFLQIWILTHSENTHEGIWEQSWEYLDLRGRKWQANGENYILRSFVICILHKILGLLNHSWWTDKACITHGTDEKCIGRFGQ
jgi:hypothetical protein